MKNLNKKYGNMIESGLLYIAKAPVKIAFVILLVGMFVGGTLYSLVEKDTSIIDGWYWSTVVMPTVGFGDFSPATIAGRWVYIFVVSCGWIATVILGGAVAGSITQSRIQNHLGTEELDDDFDAVMQQLEALKVRYVQKHMMDGDNFVNDTTADPVPVTPYPLAGD